MDKPLSEYRIQGMTYSQSRSRTNLYRVALAVIIMLQFIAAFYFCMRKTGFHYDEYYSYYSSNVTAGLVPTDNAWMDTSEIADEFMVLPGEGFNYGMVKLMQTYDVHPPFYYYILHTVCSLTPGVFSKWQGLTVNLLFWLMTFPVLTGICSEILCKRDTRVKWRILGEEDQEKHEKLCRLTTLIVVFLYGFSPAILSGVMFLRMYVLLTFLCLLTVYTDLRIIRFADEYRMNLCADPKKDREKKSDLRRHVLFGLGSFALTFIGTMTHYYYTVFLFFAAAYVTLYLFIKKDADKQRYVTDIKNAGAYAASVILGLIAAVAYYPSMLSHIFRGYRGTEATSAFFDMGNLKERAGLFVGLLDEYLISGFVYVLILDVLLLYIYRVYSSRRSKDKGIKSSFDHRIGFVAFVTVGYFLVVLKTALLNAEEAVRYEMPVYGLVILILVLAVGINIRGLTKNDGTTAGPNELNKRRLTAEQALFAVIMIGACVTQLSGLIRGKVLFLYEEDAKSYEWAAEHKDDTIVYIYNPDNQWMIWDDAKELMQYEKIFFISADNKDEIADTDVTNAKDIYVYAARTEGAKDRLDELSKAGKHRDSEKLIRELRFVDLYKID